MDDRELLDEFVENRSQGAFRELVERHLPLVYSAARRMVRDPHLAEEVAQTVFTTLAQKAKAIQPPHVLGGWLYNTTRHLAMHAVRTEQRRRQREQAAFAMHAVDLTPDDRGIAEQLEPAMAELEAEDRDALVLRFLSNRAWRDVGAELGISDEAARKRVNRAVDRLRIVLEKRSISVTTVLLTTALAASTIAIPAGLGATVTTTALASCASTAVTKATFITLKWFNAKTAAGMLAGLALVGTGAHFVQRSKATPSPPLALAAAAAPNPGGPDRTAPNRVAGILKTPDDQPIADADVYLSTASVPVPVYAAPSPQVLSTRSGADGRFSFPDDVANRAVIVVNAKGYGQATVADLAAHPELRLQPWASIAGTLRRGGTALANETIHLSRSRFGSRLQEQAYRTVHDATAKTDAAGHYVFARVAPGDTWISWRVMPDRYDVQYRYLDVSPGASLTVDLGGRGRPIQGRAVLAGSDAPVKFYGSVWPKTLHQMRRPPNWSDLSPDEQASFVVAWEKSPDAKLFNQERCPIDFRVGGDGAFVVPDLPAGSYRVVIASWTGAPMSSKMVSRGTTEVTIPEMPDGRSDQPLDLGEVQAYYVARLQAGDLAPLFEASTLEGKPLKLADYEDKYVLLNFWRTDRPETEDELENLRSAQTAWGQDKRFALIGLNFDLDLSTVRKFVADHHVTWTQCFLGKSSDVPARYRLRGPTTILIGPFGQIIRPDLAGPEIAAALQEVLGPK